MTMSEESIPSPGQTVEVIGFGRRFVAYFIDGIILWIAQFIITFCSSTAVFTVSSEGGEDAVNTLNLLFSCISILISAGYFVIFWATTGQTLGKMAMGIKIVNIDGTPISWGKALLRYLGYIVSSLVLLIGFIWIAFDARRQGWHDKIAGTYVVRKDTQFASADHVTFVPSDPGQSAIWVALAVIGLILIPICVIAILLLLGPVVGNVFSNIVEGLTTPVP